MDERRRKAYLEAMGIQVWVARGAAATGATGIAPVAKCSPSAPEPEPRPAVAALIAAAPPAARASGAPVMTPELQWTSLEQDVRSCTACKLHERRTQAVFGVGHHHAQWMVIGEAPGAEEDVQGEPFVGRAGKLLNEMLFAVGLKREQVYIANIVKCRPPNNREPQPDEAAACARYLRAQIDLIQPTLILCVGRIAATNLLGTYPNLGQYRGKIHPYADTQIPVVVTYHPAYLLRNPADKRRAWRDLQFAVSVFRPSSR